MLPADWRPLHTKDLIRVGPAADGGYVLPACVLHHTDTLIGLGVSDNWEFEKDFQEKSGCSVVCYDHTVDATFWRNRIIWDCIAFLSGKRLSRTKFMKMFKFLEYRRFFDGKAATHHRLMVGYEHPGSVSIDQIVAPFAGTNQRLFLKIDIEGWEYRVVEQLQKHSNSIVGLAIEFHDVDLHRERISQFLRDLKRFKLVHLHANNGSGADSKGDPLAVEMTLLRDDLFQPDGAGFGDLPVAGLDFPNLPQLPDFSPAFEGS